MTLSNTGATVLNNVPLSVSGTLPIKIVVRHKLVPQAAIRTYDWFIQVQIFNNVTNSLIFDTGYVFVTTRNPYDGMQFPYFTETYTLNNTGNTARFFNFIVVNTYLEPI
ncbi:MAG: hypothetical protein NZM34_13810 [Bernardetiaceae bacterium]|nr:hypothetical protein [Bernardetiaceae bacterium]